ncbi:ABC transporter substrate-binding protein [Prescottella sp. R16]|uniref:ABC transporter substrate-binding protein n=1 Tax=Prescottella sp. R16 TaxID=3064529 RepID=UPI00272EB516|nr:ABC transporter substrate-binding protein [Prescottella sp. R16]
MRLPTPKRMMPLAIAAAVTLVLTGCGGQGRNGTVEAGSDGKMHISVGYYPTILTSYLTEVAQEQGIFEANGLEVDLVPIQAGPQQTSALLGGSLDIADLPAPTMVPLMKSGDGQIVALTGGAHVNYSMVIHPGMAQGMDVGNPDAALAIKGKTVAVTVPGGTIDYFAQIAAREAGLDTKDYSTVGAGSVPAILAGFKEGRFDAAVLFPEVAHLAGEEGKDYTVLTSASATSSSTDLYKGMLQSVTGARADWVKSNPDAVTAFCTSIGEAHDWVQDPQNAQELGKSLGGWFEQPEKRGMEIFETTTFGPVLTQEIWEQQAAMAGTDTMPAYGDFVSAQCLSALSE